MLPRLKGSVWTAVVRMLVIFACSFGIAGGLCGALFEMTDIRGLALLCGAGAVIFSLAAALTEYWSLLYIPLVGVFVWAAIGGGPLRGAFNGLLAALLYPGQVGRAALLYRPDLTRAIGGLCVSLCAAACLIDAPSVLLTLAVGALLPAYLTTPSLSVLWAALAAGGVLLALARGQRGHAGVGAVVVTAGLIILSLVIAPARAPVSEPLQEAAENAYEILEAYLPARDSGYREGYSLRGDGFLPLADDFNDYLGGAAEPENATVMEVWTDRTVYLRGSPRNAYTGLSWQDTVSSQRYLYADVFQNAFRQAVLNQGIPKGAENEPLQSVHVRVIRDAATTLFAPDRTRDLSMGDASMVAYFNDASEIFLSRNLRAGDSYTLTFLPVTADLSRTRAWVEAAREDEDPRYQEILDNYLAVPEQIRYNSAVTNLSVQAAGGQENILDRALSIRDWLRANYPYTLDVSDPPANTDFVSWFLLREQKGYCTYFASAMTILCRLQGIPARFVAGYLVRPDGDGHAVVTGKNGHAWTEIYLKGFGWLTMDATPGTEETVSTDDPSAEWRERPDSGEEETTAPTFPPVEEEDEDYPTPSPDPEGEPETTPTPGQLQTPEPSREPGEDPAEETAPPSAAPLWAFLLIPLCLAAYGLIRIIRTEPVRAAGRRPDKAALILFSAVETALTIVGFPRRAEETLDEYGRRLEERYPLIPLPAAFSAYSAEAYGEHAMKPAILVQVWKRLMKALSPLDRIRVRLKLAGRK